MGLPKWTLMLVHQWKFVMRAMAICSVTVRLWSSAAYLATI